MRFPFLVPPRCSASSRFFLPLLVFSLNLSRVRERETGKMRQLRKAEDASYVVASLERSGERIHKP